MAFEPDQVAVDALQRVFGGETLAEMNGVPPKELEALYAQAFDFVEREDFESALDPFVFLVVNNPYDFRFQFGYGLCLHMLGRVEDAAKHYGLAYMLDPSDAGCAFRLGECHVAMGDREAAVEAFETAVALCNPPHINPEIRMASEAAMHALHA